MRAIIRLRAIGCCVGLVLLASAPIGWAEELPKPLVGLAPASGIVTGMVGGPQRIETGAAPTLLKIGDKIGGGDELRLGPGETVDVLWDRRAVITLQEEARVHISEPRHGQTELHLHQGAVRIVLSYSAGRMTDTLTVQTPLVRVISRGGILEASTVGGEQRSLLARLVNAATVDTLRVFEGQVRVEPLTGQGKPFSLKTGSEVSLKPEAVGEVSEGGGDHRPPVPLAAREEHRSMPNPIAKQIANAQIGAALELEQGFREKSAPENGKELPGSGIKGLILATTTGLPVVPGVSNSVNGAASAAPALPPPTLISPATVGNVGPSQAGGLNTRELLRQILSDVERNGKGRGGRK